MRKLAVDVLAPSSGQQEALARQFARLSALPMFVQDDDDEAGVESFAWTTPAWTFLRRDEVPAQRERNGAAALARMRSAGRVTGLLSQLLGTLCGKIGGGQSWFHDKAASIIVQVYLTSRSPL